MREFNALEAIAEFAKAALAIDLETHRALEEAAKIVETEAKAELGTYQNEAGPFAAWAELADRTKDDRVKAGFSENDPGRRTGEMADSIGHEVSGREAVVGSNSDEMVYFELGTEKQPPRSALGGAAVRKTDEVVDLIGEAAVMGMIGGHIKIR